MVTLSSLGVTDYFFVMLALQKTDFGTSSILYRGFQNGFSIICSIIYRKFYLFPFFQKSVPTGHNPHLTNQRKTGDILNVPLPHGHYFLGQGQLVPFIGDNCAFEKRFPTTSCIIIFALFVSISLVGGFIIF